MHSTLREGSTNGMLCCFLKNQFIFKRIFLLFMFLILLEKGFAQNLPKEKGAVDTLNVVELKELVDGAIDPRKYVTVFYKKRPGQPSQKTLAVWKWSSYSPHQKYRVVDKEGVLNIYFDKEGLSKNTRFKGNISLSASVK